MEEKQTKRQWGSIFTGLAIILMAFILMREKLIFISFLSDIVGGILILDCLGRLYHLWYPSHTVKNKGLLVAGVVVIEFALACFLFFYSQRTALLAILAIGFYHLILALANSISLILLVKNQAKPLFLQTLRTLTHYFLALLAFWSDANQLAILNIIGCYMILMGLTFIRDGRRVLLSEKKETELKRSIRFPLPTLLNAFLPRHVLSKINIHLEKEGMTDEIKHHLIPDRYPTASFDDHLEILVHVSRLGLGNVGHVNIAYKDKLYNFGNHDYHSRSMAGLLGDGVLAVADKDKFMDIALASQDTVFEYVVSLSQLQKEKLEAKLSQLKTLLEEWTLETEKQEKSFAGLLKRRANARLYKFNTGKFKNYFVFGSNCVLLTDDLLGSIGLDLFVMVGFLSPGTYFDYLNRELKKEGSNVVQRQVYSRRINKYLKKVK